MGERTTGPRRSYRRTGGLGPFVVREESEVGYIRVRVLIDWTGLEGDIVRRVPSLCPRMEDIGPDPCPAPLLMVVLGLSQDLLR